MKKTVPILLMLWLAPMIIPSTIHAAETPEATDEFLQKFSDALKNVKAVYSEFVQERHMELLSEPLVSKGVILFKKPGQVRWETTEPYRTILIASDKKVSQFEWMDSRWQKLNIGYASAMEKIMESLTITWNGRLAEQSKDYTFSLQAGDQMVLTMTPRDAGVREFMNAIEMHIDKKSFAAHKVVLRESSGDITIIRMLTQRINADLPAVCFDLDAPRPLDEIQQSVRNEK